MYGQRLFQPFLQAPGSAGIDLFELPEDFLQRRFSLRVAAFLDPVALQNTVPVRRIQIVTRPVRSVQGSIEI